MYPVDSAISGFYASAGLWVVLHNLSGADFPVDINLPKNNFSVSCGSQQVVVGCFGNLYVGEIFAEEPYEVGVEGEGAFQVFVGNVVGRFHGLVGLRLRHGLGLRLREI